MPEVGSVKYKVELDDSQLDKDISKTESEISSKLGAGDIAKQLGSKVLQGVGGVAMQAGERMLGFAQDSVKTGAIFDASMANVAAISGAASDEMDLLRAKAQEMGATTSFSASQAADAMSYMAMAGWKTDDMLSGISGIMNLAAASGEDLATTSDIVTDALTGFGLSAEDSGHFADILAAASSNANTNVSLMGETFKYVAPVAGSMGISAESMAESIGLIANAGIKGSQAGTSLRAILTRLSTDAGASSKSLGALGILTEELGVDFFDSEGQVRDFTDILDEARGVWGELSDEDAARFAKKIAGQEGISAWLALMNAAPADIDKLRGSIETCSDSTDEFSGTAEKMAGIQLDNLSGDITLMQSAMESAQITISDALTPTLRDFVQYGTNALGELDTAFQEGGLSGAVDAFGQILTEGLNLILSKAPDLVDAGLQLIISLATGLVDNLPEMLDAALEVVMALVDGIIDNIPKLVDTAIKLITNLAQFIVKNAPKITEKGVELIAALVKGLIKAIPDIVKAIPDIIQAIVTVFKEFNWLSLGIDLVKGIAKGIGDAAGEIADAAMDAARGALRKAKEFLGIHSPSRRAAEEIGEPYSEGVAEGIDEGMTEIDRSLGLMEESLTAGVDLPDLRKYTSDLGASISATASTQVTVPVMLDGREIARGTARYMDAQLAWEAR